MAQTGGFEVVQDEAEVVQHPASPPKKDHAAETQMLLLALKALSQRALVAASALVSGAALFSVWLLWYFVLPTSPSINQLIGVGMFSVFVLSLEWIRRR